MGTDDYHCFLIDPALAKDTFVTGYDIRPEKRSEVHHVILFRITPDQVAAAQRKDDTTPGQGWTCFGNSGIEDGPAAQLNDSSWIGAWAPGGGEVTYGGRLGVPMPKGSMIVAQVHYNLLGGTTPDQSSVVLRESADRATTGLRTVLLPAPVELPCRPDNRGPLCDRAKAVADVKARFGQGPGATADLLHLLCPDAEVGVEQTCDRTFAEPMTIRGVAGHMHLLGTSISVVADPGTSHEEKLLDIGSWNFDDQGARMLPKPYTLEGGREDPDHLPPPAAPARPAAVVREAAPGPLRRLGRRLHRRDVPGHAAGQLLSGAGAAQCRRASTIRSKVVRTAASPTSTARATIAMTRWLSLRLSRWEKKASWAPSRVLRSRPIRAASSVPNGSCGPHARAPGSRSWSQSSHSSSQRCTALCTDRAPAQGPDPPDRKPDDRRTAASRRIGDVRYAAPRGPSTGHP